MLWSYLQIGPEFVTNLSHTFASIQPIMKPKILIIEDESAIREMISMALRPEGYEILELDTGKEAIQLIIDHQPALLLLDWMLPDISGLDLAKRIKRDDSISDTPIIMLTARSEENDKVRGLESGADDYITKPFSTRELKARIKAVLRRSTTSEGQVLTADGLQLDSSTHRVSIFGEEIPIGPTEFKLLQFFMTHSERVYSRNQLIDQVWGGNVYIDERTVDVHIRRLRKTLSPHHFDKMIQTVRGSGYRFSLKL